MAGLFDYGGHSNESNYDAYGFDGPYNQSGFADSAYGEWTPDGDYGESGDADGLVGLQPKTLALAALAVLAAGVLACRLGSLRAALQRRAAANAARVAGRDGELSPVSSWFGSTSVVKVFVEVGGATHTIGAARDGLSAVSQLPFLLTDACEASGSPELAGLDIVELCIQKRAELHFDASDGRQRPISGAPPRRPARAARARPAHGRLITTSRA